MAHTKEILIIFLCVTKNFSFDKYIKKYLEKNLKVEWASLEDNNQQSKNYSKILLFVVFSYNYGEEDYYFQDEYAEDFRNTILKDVLLDAFCDYFENYYGDLLKEGEINNE